MAITETCSRGNHGDLAQPGRQSSNTKRHNTYRLCNCPRALEKKRARGGFLYQSSFKVIVNRKEAMQSFEFMGIDVVSSASYTNFVVFYHSPPSSKNKLSYNDFLSEFAGFMEGYSMTSCCFEVIGDFIVHWDKLSDSNVKRFVDLIEYVYIVQHVDTATHIDGHIIDLVLTRVEDHGITLSSREWRTTVLPGPHASGGPRYYLVLTQVEDHGITWSSHEWRTTVLPGPHASGGPQYYLVLTRVEDHGITWSSREWRTTVLPGPHASGGPRYYLVLTRVEDHGITWSSREWRTTVSPQRKRFHQVISGAVDM